MAIPMRDAEAIRSKARKEAKRDAKNPDVVEHEVYRKAKKRLEAEYEAAKKP